MAEYDDDCLSLGATRIEPGAHKTRPNALPLVFRQDRHRRQADSGHGNFCHRVRPRSDPRPTRVGPRIVDFDNREENVADDAIVNRRDQRDRARDTAERVNERGFVRPPERALMNNPDVIRVARFLRSDGDRLAHGAYASVGI
jgi:hypothetical protein